MPPAAVAPKAERGAFVLLGGKGVAERKFDTLAEAVHGASDGDTIEVRGNGPFVTRPDQHRKHALTIRAGDGFRPVIRFDPRQQNAAAAGRSGRWCWKAWNCSWRARSPQASERHARAFAGGVRHSHVANCRLRAEHATAVVRQQRRPATCGIASSWPDAAATCVWRPRSADRRRLRRRELRPDRRLASMALTSRPDGRRRPVHAQHARSPNAASVVHSSTDQPESAAAKAPTASSPRRRLGQRLRRRLGAALRASTSTSSSRSLSAPRTRKRLLPRLVAWRGRSNLLSRRAAVLLWQRALRAAGTGETRQRAWRTGTQFWGVGGRRARRRARSVPGRRPARQAAQPTPEKLTPEDFRLPPDSAGYRAGKDGKDLAPTWTWSAPARPTSAGRRRPSTSSGSRTRDRSRSDVAIARRSSES